MSRWNREQMPAMQKAHMACASQLQASACAHCMSGHAWGEIWQVWGKYHVLEVRGTFPCIIRYFLLMYP